MSGSVSIAVERAAFPECAPGEYYWADLEGLEVRTLDGASLGKVDHLLATGGNDVLVLDQAGRLIPFVTGWMGENHFAPVPTALYGAILLLSAIAYVILQRAILRAGGSESVLARAIGRDFKGKISLVLYVIAIPLAFFSPLISGGIYAIAAMIWLIPDRRIERTLDAHSEHRAADQ